MNNLSVYGDSIVDNGTYVSDNEFDVADQLRALDLSVKSYAKDGARCADILTQLDENPPEEESTVFLTGGGNDAIDTLWILGDDTDRSFPEVLGLLTNIREQFRAQYTPILDRLIGQKVLVATIYDPNLTDPSNIDLMRPAQGLLTAYNDVIQQEALARGFDVLELRTMFSKPADYANPIEPSAQGGAKTAKAVSDWHVR